MVGELLSSHPLTVLDNKMNYVPVVGIVVVVCELIVFVVGVVVAGAVVVGVVVVGVIVVVVGVVVRVVVVGVVVAGIVVHLTGWKLHLFSTANVATRHSQHVQSTRNSPRGLEDEHICCARTNSLGTGAIK